MKRLFQHLVERVRYSRRVRTYDDPGPRVTADPQVDTDLALRSQQAVSSMISLQYGKS